MQFNAITIFTTLLAVAQTLFAVPVPADSVHGPNKLIVFNPQIKDQSIGDTWVRGTRHTVAWETSNIPEEKLNSTANLYLGCLQNESENLDMDYPLASDFPLTDGEVSFNVPRHLEPKSCYIVALMGDSGNISRMFTVA